MTGGVLALKGALARGALLSKHNCTLFLSGEEYERISTFRASDSWGRKVARRFKLTSITLHGEAGDVDPSQHEKLMNSIWKIENQFGPLRTCNMDETFLMYKCFPNQGYVELVKKKAFKCFKTMNSKDSFKMYLCTNLRLISLQTLENMFACE